MKHIIHTEDYPPAIFVKVKYIKQHKYYVVKWTNSENKHRYASIHEYNVLYIETIWWGSKLWKAIKHKLNLWHF